MPRGNETVGKVRKDAPKIKPASCTALLIYNGTLGRTRADLGQHVYGTIDEIASAAPIKIIARIQRAQIARLDGLQNEMPDQMCRTSQAMRSETTGALLVMRDFGRLYTREQAAT